MCAPEIETPGNDNVERPLGRGCWGEASELSQTVTALSLATQSGARTAGSQEERVLGDALKTLGLPSQGCVFKEKRITLRKQAMTTLSTDNNLWATFSFRQFTHCFVFVTLMPVLLSPFINLE